MDIKYLVLELQVNEQGAVSNIITTYNTQREGESAYYAVLSAAAISNLPRHTVYLLTDNGVTMQSKCYEKEVTPIISE